MHRRGFLRESSGLVALGALGFVGLNARRSAARTYGSLVSDPRGILDLPPDFSYRILQKVGDAMTDGNRVRPAPDGMAAFKGPNGTIVLMRNHELPSGYGGVSRVVLDEKTLAVKSSNDVLTGTSVNCAGGPSPWGWLTCEEVSGLGGVWLCPTEAARVLAGSERKRIDSYGSFKHEAVAIDPKTLTAYLTEDDGPSHIYRMVPTDAKKDPFVGTLYAAKRKGVDSYDTSRLRAGDEFEIEWVKVDPDSARENAQSAGAAIFYRGEGIWWFESSAYFSATMFAQVWKLTPSETGGKVSVVATDFDSPDNITVAPWGDLFVAEDSQNNCRLRIVEASGVVTDFARNAMGMAQEFAGVCFSPDGKVLFVNLQKGGLTLAITGPFDRLVPPPKKAEPDAPSSGSTTEPASESKANSGLCQIGRGVGI